MKAGLAVAVGFVVIVAVVLFWRPISGVVGLDTTSAEDLYSPLNALLSGAALLGVVVTVLLQRTELELQRRELELNREELARQSKELGRAAGAQERSEALALEAARLSAAAALVAHYDHRVAAAYAGRRTTDVGEHDKAKKKESDLLREQEPSIRVLADLVQALAAQRRARAGEGDGGPQPAPEGGG